MTRRLVFAQAARADVRSTPHGSHVIFFRYIGDSLEIVSILHGSRDLHDYFAGGQ